MVNVRLCDDIICHPTWAKFHLCCRCIREQYDNLIETIDDSIDVDDSWLFDDEEDVESSFNYDEI